MISARIDKYTSSILILFTFLLLAVRLGSAVAYQNYSIILLIGTPFLFFIALKSNVIPIAIILLTVSFGAIEGNLVPPQIMWMPELLSGLILIKAIVSRFIEGKNVNLFGIWVVLPFLIFTSASMLYNSTGILSTLLFLRLLFRYYLLFLAIINLDLDDKSMKLIINVLVFIFLMHLPLSLVKLFVYGQGEASLGLNSHALPTFVPLIALVFIVSYHFLYRKSILNILLSLGFVGFSIIGEKRAFIFFLPVILAYLAWYLRDDIGNIFRYLVLGGVTLALSVYLSFRLIPTLNPQREVWGEFDPMHALNYAYIYTTGTTNAGMSTGRMSATVHVFKQICSRGLSGFLVGFGPGSIIKSRFEIADRRGMVTDRFGVLYGATGLSWLALQVGYLGAFIYIALFYLILRGAVYCFADEMDPYWRSFGLGMIGFSFIMLLMILSYTPAFNSDAISAFCFCLAGFTMKRIERFENENTQKSESDYTS
jgi:hypothetical protein